MLAFLDSFFANVTINRYSYSFCKFSGENNKHVVLLLNAIANMHQHHVREVICVYISNLFFISLFVNNMYIFNYLFTLVSRIYYIIIISI